MSHPQAKILTFVYGVFLCCLPFAQAAEASPSRTPQLFSTQSEFYHISWLNSSWEAQDLFLNRGSLLEAQVNQDEIVRKKTSALGNTRVFRYPVFRLCLIWEAPHTARGRIPNAKEHHEISPLPTKTYQLIFPTRESALAFLQKLLRLESKWKKLHMPLSLENEPR